MLQIPTSRIEASTPLPVSLENEDAAAPSARPKSLLTRLYSHALHNFRTQWKILVFGQVLSFLLACTGAAQSTLALNCHLSAPTFSVGLFYFGLTFCLIPAYRDGKRIKEHEASIMDTSNSSSRSVTVTPRYSFFGGRLPLEGPPLLYLVMALMDVYANYFTVLAFKYTTITSVTLFDALAIPSSMLLSRIFLSRSYTKTHIAGVLSCMVGILFNIFQDYEDDESGEPSTNDETYPHKLRGDTLAVLAGLMFGANNVLAEVAVRTLGGVYEYLGMMGFFATLICSIQTIILEREEVAAFFGSQEIGASCSEFEAWWLLMGFSIASILSYLGAARFLQVSEAAFFNLSLLTGDLWSVAFSIVVEHIIPHPMFYGALVFIVSGVFIYETAPTPVEEDRPILHQRDWKETNDDEVIDFQQHDLELEVHLPGRQIS